MGEIREKPWRELTPAVRSMCVALLTASAIVPVSVVLWMIGCLDWLGPVLAYLTYRIIVLLLERELMKGGGA